MASAVTASASRATRVGTRRASSSSTSACAATPGAAHGQATSGAVCPEISWDRAARAMTTEIAVDSSHAGTGRHRASTTVAPCPIDISSAYWGFWP